MANPDRGDVAAASFRLPFSAFASPEARDVFSREVLDAAPPPGDILARRAFYDAFNDRLLEDMLQVYEVEITPDRLGGVGVHRVRPRGGVKGSRILINFHGGGFMWGSGAGALLEAVPIAVAMGEEVITVDYRLAPEHRHPAALEDALAVYKTLVGAWPAATIGVYGCSAGAMLTTQLLAAIVEDGLERPGAAAILGGCGIEFQGDSAYATALMLGQAGPETATATPPLAAWPYFAGADTQGPIVNPSEHAKTLAGFPPSLLITASRDFAASAVSIFHRRLIAAGVEASFFSFDGLWHAFQVFCRLPESQETYRLMADFFDRNLAC